MFPVKKRRKKAVKGYDSPDIAKRKRKMAAKRKSHAKMLTTEDIREYLDDADLVTEPLQSIAPTVATTSGSKRASKTQPIAENLTAAKMPKFPSGVVCALCLDSPADDYISTDCGHIFHKHCWAEFMQSSNSSHCCPICQQIVENIRPIFIQLSDTHSRYEDEFKKLKMENETFKKQVFNCKKMIQILQFQKNWVKNCNATCFNCERENHETKNCPSECTLKTIAEASSVFKESSYTNIARIPGTKAGTIVSFYEKALNRNLSRVEVQVAMALHFFENCCSNCGSTLHTVENCTKPADPEVKLIWEMIKEIHNPKPIEERFMEFERQQHSTRNAPRVLQ